jgi:hypothetical protein
MTKPTKKRTDKDGVVAAEALEALFASGYVSKKKLYWENFVRGIFFSIGSVLGATIVIAALLWLLSLFGEIPILGRFTETIETTIQNNR